MRCLIKTLLGKPSGSVCTELNALPVAERCVAWKLTLPPPQRFQKLI